MVANALTMIAFFSVESWRVEEVKGLSLSFIRLCLYELLK